MTNEVQYEEVPQEDLRDDQIFHVNSSKATPSSEAGAVAVAGKGIYEGTKAVPKAAKYIPEHFMPNAFKGKPSVTIEPMTPPSITTKPPIPTTVSEFYNPVMVSEEGIGPGAAKNRLHNYDQKIGNALNDKWLANPEPGYHLEGNRIVATPMGADLSAPPTPSAVAPIEPLPPKPLTSTQRAMQMIEGVGAKAKPVLNVINPVLQKLNPAMVGLGYFGAGTEGMEALKRAQHGDYGRALIDLAGAGGTLASIHAPHPLAKLLGLGTGLGAHYLNEKLDEKYGRNYAEGGLAHLAEGRQPGKSDESSAAFGHFPQITPKRANPQGGALQGYLDALVGMPKNEDTSVLIPQDSAYREAYDTAEPYGVALNLITPIKGLATLGATKMAAALAGKGILPAAITAWHGTPHKILGGFDLAKVGTGEGNQTFGHGMYFGQERKTGEEYQRRLSEKLSKNTGLETKGNLYKVDIPDEQIPKMLDLDKPISEQMHVWEALHPDVRKAIDDLMETQHRNPISEVPEVYTGHNLYRALTHHDVGEVLPPELPNSNWFKGDTSYEKHASQYLNSLGIPGIKYLDQGSRGNAPIVRKVNVLDPETNTYTKVQYEVDPRHLDPNKKHYFSTPEEAQAKADSYGTRNFVSFDPATVKILEENDNPLDILKGSK